MRGKKEVIGEEGVDQERNIQREEERGVDHQGENRRKRGQGIVTRKKAKVIVNERDQIQERTEGRERKRRTKRKTRRRRNTERGLFLQIDLHHCQATTWLKLIKKLNND
jgi:hypothetical protein